MDVVELPAQAKNGPAPRRGGALREGRGPPGGADDLLLALTVVVVLVIVLMLPTQVVLFGVLGALLGYYVACRRGGGGGPGGAPPGREGFSGEYTGAPPPPPYAPLAGSHELYGPADVPAPLPVFSDTAPPPQDLMGAAGVSGRMQYPGAIELDEYETEAGAGHIDRSRYEVAPEGNPFDPMRVRSDLAAAPCVDDEANDNEIDGDERMAQQGAARNDATRTTAGTINRLKDMRKYLEEETLEAEEREWWGRNEV